MDNISISVYLLNSIVRMDKFRYKLPNLDISHFLSAHETRRLPKMIIFFGEGGTSGGARGSLLAVLWGPLCGTEN